MLDEGRVYIMANLIKSHFFIEPNVCARVTYRRGKARLSISNVTERHNESKTEQSICVLGQFAVNFTRQQLVQFVQVAPALVSALDMMQKSKTLSKSSVVQCAAEDSKAENDLLDKQNKEAKVCKIKHSSEKPRTTTATNVSIATQTEEKSENLNKNPLSDIVQRIKTQNKIKAARPTVLLDSALPQKRKAKSSKDIPTAEIQTKRSRSAMKTAEGGHLQKTSRAHSE